VVERQTSKRSKCKKANRGLTVKESERAAKASAIPNAMFKEIRSPIALRKPKVPYRFDPIIIDK
jgi:hypothetical protein